MTSAMMANAAMLAVVASTPPVSGGAVDIGPGPHLFVDDVLIASRTGVVRTIHPCRKLTRPVLEPEYPWEGQRVYVYGSVYYDAALRRFRMWYMSSPLTGKRDPRLNRSRNALVLYATSKDGLRWHKPRLGLYDFDGSRDNNIVYGLDSPSAILDVNESDPARRYKMLGYVRTQARGPGAGASYSADGLTWHDYGGEPLFKTHDTITLTRDPKTGEYLAFHKIMAAVRGYPRRLVGLATSSDLRKWSAPELVLVPDEKDDAWAKLPGQRTEFYDMSAFPYGSQFLGLVAVFRVMRRIEKTAPAQSCDDGPIHAELVHSRDGRQWHRLDERKPIIPNGPADFDAGCILGMINTPVIHGDEIWVYYTGITTTHGGAMPAKRITIGRAAWRLDGFVSLDAGPAGGVVEMVPVRLAGGRLIVNADATGGRLAVEVLDETGKPPPGYSTADCVALHEDAVRHAVRWKQRDTLPRAPAVRLRFHLTSCQLFSFTVR
jgi:hypothetical protein